MLAILANETSAVIQFRLTQFLCYISPEERAAVEVKTIFLCTGPPMAPSVVHQPFAITTPQPAVVSYQTPAVSIDI